MMQRKKARLAPHAVALSIFTSLAGAAWGFVGSTPVAAAPEATSSIQSVAIPASTSLHSASEATPVTTTPSTPSAKVDPSATAQSATCHVERVEHGSDKAGDLLFACGQEGLWLGRSISFTAAYNPTLGRYLVVNRTEDGDQVMLIRPHNGDVPALIENMTNDLAAAARNVKIVQTKGLSDGVDISAFAASGTVKLTGASPDGPIDKKAAAVAVKLTDDGHSIRVRAAVPASVASGN